MERNTVVSDKDAARKNDETDSKDDETKPEDGIVEHEEVTIEEDHRVPGGGWGWMIVFGCLVLRTVLGGFMRSNGLFFVKFLEKFNGSAAETAWVTSLSATIRLLLGPVVSILSSRISCRKLTAIGTAIFVIAVHISSYSTSLVYLYFTYGVIGGFGRSFINTPLTLLLGGYFDKRRSLAFGVASAGFGMGGFIITPIIEILFQEYGFTGTFILLSGIACHMFVCVCLFRTPDKTIGKVKSKKGKSTKNSEAAENKLEKYEVADETETAETDQTTALMTSHISSTDSVHLTNVPKEDSNSIVKENPELSNGVVKTVTENTKEKPKKKLISFSVLKDIRFVTLLIATLVFMLPSSGLFLPALAKSRGVTDIQTAYLLSIIAASDTVSRIVSGFILDLKPVRHLRPYIYNAVSFVQCIAILLFPSLQTFGHFVAVCILHGAVMGMKAAQRNVILVDILGVKKLPSSFAFLLTVQGIGTLIGPPVAGHLKDTYGKYDYTFYFGGACMFVGALILLSGNIRNYYNKKKAK